VSPFLYILFSVDFHEEPCPLYDWSHYFLFLAVAIGVYGHLEERVNFKKLAISGNQLFSRDLCYIIY